MRMWMVPPETMCRQHLLGEHLECHMFLGSLLRGVDISGYIKKGFCYPSLLKDRHDALALEMLRRGYKHNTLFEPSDCAHLPFPKPNVKELLRALHARCLLCESKYRNATVVRS
jgi:hypothetical protein